jgi:hypothetical protein
MNTEAGLDPRVRTLLQEAAFMSYLRLKEAYARAAGEEEHAAVTAAAAARFSADHLARFAEPLAALLAGSGVDYLALASSRLAEWVGARPRPAQLTVLPAPLEDDESEFPCAEG